MIQRISASSAMLMLMLFSVLVLAGCSDSDNIDTSADNSTPAVSRGVGAVYTETNAADGNEIVVYRQNDNGSLTEVDRVATGGNGSGPGSFPRHPLVSQDTVILSPDNQFLFAVDAGSNEITSFTVDRGELSRVGTVSSGGELPVSLTLDGDRLYVVNALAATEAGEDAGNISGFRVGDDGGLTPIDGSTRPLSGIDTPLPGNRTLPAEVQFSPDGSLLFVTEKATSRIDVYTVDNDLPSQPLVENSAGTTPFGVEFDQNGFFFVTEANTTAPRTPVAQGGSVSSYSLQGSSLNVVRGAVPTGQSATCWVVITADNRFAYLSSSASATLTGLQLADDGTFSFINDEQVAVDLGAPSEAFPLDMALAGGFVYVLDAGNQQTAQDGGNDGTVSGFEIGDDGTLTPVDDPAVDLPGATVQGLAAYQF